MKFTQQLKAQATPEWRSHYIQYSKLRKIIEAYQCNLSSHSSHSSILKLKDDSEKRFFELIEQELNKINEFYTYRISEAHRMWKDLKREISSIIYTICQEREEFHHHMSLSKFDDLDYSLIRSTRKRNKKMNRNYRSLDIATTEFYLLANHIKQFQQLNFTGFRKILKKFDKVFKTNRGESYRIEKVQTSLFYVDILPQDILLEVEEIYVRFFTEGKRSDGMKKLRFPATVTEPRIDTASFLFGFYSSASLVIFLTIVLAYFYCGIEPIDQSDILILASQLMLIVYILGVGVNLYFWKRCAVNHILIFEINPRDHINFVQCFEIGFQALLIWNIFLFIYLYAPINATLRKILPSCISLVYLSILIFPFNILYKTSRYWTLNVSIRNLKSPFIGVRFADFWMYDQFCSLSFSLSHAIGAAFFRPLLLLTCSQSYTCTILGLLIVAGVRVLPYNIRGLQSLRRFYDFYRARNVEFVHIFNAVKYTLSLIVLVLNEVVKSQHKRNEHLYRFMQFLRFISTLYLMFWDVFIDWGFFGTTQQIKNLSLDFKIRKNRIYHYKYLYVLALIENIVIRILTFLPSFLQDHFELSKFKHLCLVLFMSFLEIIRRIIWNFFRLENEHLNNVGQFRIIREMPLLNMSFRNLPSAKSSNGENEVEIEGDANVIMKTDVDIIA